ncbi:histidine phosphatase superfamily [Aspergillus egyptiacus]|nr:histidine phosphatase superfamily [Aspergillus egyptiacus]
MGKPRMIILIRHAQSEGNKNREIHQTIPDHRVKLTPEGHRQALEAGTRLRALLRPDDTIHFFTSPYRRTRETTEGILNSLTADTPSPSPFPRHMIKVYEEPRLREQDFGNFQPCSAEMERMWLERADYGHFFYRIPNGESAADAYDRVSGFNESMWRLFAEKDFASVCVLVTHGLMTRVFLMKWYHWSVEYFEDLRNIDHCEFVIMKLNEDSGKYALQNQMRTWSELKREKEAERQRERAAKGLAPQVPNTLEAPVAIRRKWGGCPDGCNHGLHRKNSTRSSRRHSGDQHKQPQDTISHDQASKEMKNTCSHPPAEPHSTSDDQKVTAPEPAIGDRLGDEMPLRALTSNPQYPPTSEPAAQNKPKHQPNSSPVSKGSNNLSILHDDNLLHPLHPKYGLIHLVGRDGGGTLSGANSVAHSEDEHDHNHHHYRHGHDHNLNHHHHHHHHHNNPHSHEHHHHHEPKQHAENARAGSKRHKPRHSQDLDHDGDDEGSGHQTPKLRRTRSQTHRHGHNHSHSHLSPTLTRSNTTIRKALPSTAEQTQEIGSHSHYVGGQINEAGAYGTEEEDDGDDNDLEQARKEDQSIRGSVY